MLETSPTARALIALETLQQRGNVTAEELARRLGVSSRAARRYVEILREAGIAVESERGRHGGYRIGRGRRPAPVVFTAAEAVDLVMAVLAGQHGDAEPLAGALDKIIRVLPDPVARPADALRRHARAVVREHETRPDPVVTSDVVAAIADRRRVRLGYRSGGGAPRSFDVDPWAVVVRFGTFYLLCLAHHAAAIRTLRVDRIDSVTRLADTFTLPDDLDAPAMLEEHLGAGWPFAVRVTFDAPYAEVRPWVPATTGRLSPVDDGERCVLTGTTNDPAAYAGERLAGVPFAFVVHDGPELRTAVAELGRRLRAASPDA